MKTLAEILADPVEMAALRRRAHGDAGFPLAQHFKLPSLESRYENAGVRPKQRVNTAPAARARTQDAVSGRAEEGGRDGMA